MTHLNSINYVDIILLAAMLLSVIIGVVRGFTQEILGIIGWLGAVFTAIYTLPFIRPFARELISSPLMADVTAGVLIFLTVLIILTLICRSLSGRIKGSALGGIDRSLGLLFGAVRGFLVLSFIYLMGTSLTKTHTWPEKIHTAKALPFLDHGAQFIKSLLPHDFRPQTMNPDQPTSRSSEDMMKSLSRLVPKKKSPDQPTPYKQEQKEKMDTLFKK